MMKCKKAIMGLAGILILLFHFYIPFLENSFETGIVKSAYIGVDIFFFISAYSLGRNESIKAWPFIKNRLLNLYVPFVIFAIVAVLYKGWGFKRFLLIISGIELFNRGGGAFLWFVPGILLFYLITPLIISLKKRYGYKTLLGTIILWGVIAILCQYILGYTAIFILLNRLPIFIIGFYYESMRRVIASKKCIPVIIIMLAAGGFLIFKWGSVVRVNYPLKDVYYLLAIPVVVAIVMLMDYISVHFNAKYVLLSIIGGCTLEMYCLQMIFGFDLIQYLLKVTDKNKLMAFIGTSVSLVGGAYICSLIKKGFIIWNKK